MGYELKPGVTGNISQGGEYDNLDSVDSVNYSNLSAESAAIAVNAATNSENSANQAAVSATESAASATISVNAAADSINLATNLDVTANTLSSGSPATAEYDPNNLLITFGIPSGSDGVGVPTGGTTGQSLIKNSNTDYDAVWVTLDTGVTSINGFDGNVVLTASDVGAAAIGDNNDITSLSGVSGGISTPDFIQFDTSITPTVGVGKLQWDPTYGTLQVGLAGGNVNLQFGQETNQYCLNNTGTAISDFSAVYITGAQGNRPTIALAQASSESTSAVIIGITTETINNNQSGYVTTDGMIHNINTSALTEGAPIWLSPTVAGGVTSTKPSAPNHLVLLGYCIRQHAAVGQIYVKVQNGYELDELHNVSIVNPLNGQVLTYNSTNGLWENKEVIGGVASVNGHTGVVNLDAADVGAATAAQGILADSALQPAAIGTTIQPYDSGLSAWATITPSSKQDTLVSGTNIKTVNGSSLLGAGNIVITGGGAVDSVNGYTGAVILTAADVNAANQAAVNLLLTGF